MSLSEKPVEQIQLAVTLGNLWCRIHLSRWEICQLLCSVMLHGFAKAFDTSPLEWRTIKLLLSILYSLVCIDLVVTASAISTPTCTQWSLVAPSFCFVWLCWTGAVDCMRKKVTNFCVGEWHSNYIEVRIVDCFPFTFKIINSWSIKIIIVYHPEEAVSLLDASLEDWIVSRGSSITAG